MKMPAPILLLDNSYSFGGAINSLSNLVKALDKEKFSPVVVSGQPPDFLEKHFDCSWYHYKPKLPWVDNAVFEKIKAIPLFKIKVLQKALYISRSVYWLFFIIFPEAFKYYAIGRTHKVAMVHLNNIFGSQLSGIISAKLLGVPCVAHLRDFEKAGFFNRCLAKLIDQHIAISTSIRDNLAMLEVPDEKISIIYDAIDLDEFDTDVSSKYLLDEFCIGKDQKIFGIFGRVLAWKGTREFVLAAAEVIKRIPEAMAFIVGSESDGDKEYAREVNLLVNNMSLQDRIVFTGYREDVSAFMRIMNVIVHASTRPEPFGMVLIEGMAMEKPVVATKGGGPLDIVVENETGYLVNSFDYRDMAEKIAYLLENPEIASAMGKNGKARVLDAFTKERHGAGIEKIYKSITNF